MKIITLTLNPAFDMHCCVDVFKPFHENIAEITSKDAGGKGVNISRALANNGIANLAVIIVGKENAAEFVDNLKRDNITYKTVETQGRIRKNITLHSGDGAAETRISFHGFVCDKSILESATEKIGGVDEETIVTMTGSIPDGVSVADVKLFLDGLKKQGAKIVVDSRSFTLRDIKEFQPWLIKPNKDEITAYTGNAVQSAENALAIAKDLHNDGIENVMISLGGDGAVLSCRAGDFIAKAPEIYAVSTVGAGDSMIAGFIAAYATGAGASACLKHAVAFGTAACMQEGTKPPEKKNVEFLEYKVIVKEA